MGGFLVLKLAIIYIVYEKYIIDLLTAALLGGAL